MTGFGRYLFQGMTFLNDRLCRHVYHVSKVQNNSLPKSGPAILVSNHSCYCDPLVISTTFRAPIRFLVAREVFYRPYLRWMFQAFAYIPVLRGHRDVGAVRHMLRTLRDGHILGMFPQGGIDEHREEQGHLGIGYLALKTGAPIIPVAVCWEQPRPIHLLLALCRPGKAVVRYGSPLRFEVCPKPNRAQIDEATCTIMNRISEMTVGYLLQQSI